MKEFMKYGIGKAVSVFLILIMAVSLISSIEVKVQVKQNNKIVILYFSGTGITEGAAKRIKNKTKGNLMTIKAIEPYTEEALDYSDNESRVTKEHESADSTVRPEIDNLSQIKKTVKKAEIVYIGYLIWWGEVPHIVYNLVENISLKEKTVVPFCISISSGLRDSSENLKANANISSKTN